MIDNFPYKHKFFEIFEQISSIPHGSGDTARLAKYCVDFARSHGASAVTDKAGNVVIKVKASEGFENADTVIIQGHLDMVCEKTPDSEHNFESDPLKLTFDGKYIKAVDTTLGGDDGIAVAYGLALVADVEAQHPPLEILLTTDEETGLNGAFGLEEGSVSGKTLINIDSEEEGILLCGCAGGVTAKVTGHISTEITEGELLTVTLGGLAGGHSGVEINKRRINAARLLARLICETDMDFGLLSFSGGGKNNAIPCNAKAELIISDGGAAEFTDRINRIFEKVEVISAEDKPKLQISVSTESGTCATAADSRRMLEYICGVPDGVIEEAETGVVTSLNTGVSNYANGTLYCEALLRSTVNSDLDVLSEKVLKTAEKFGLSAAFSDRYPAWEYNPKSKLREIMVRVFEKMYGKKPEVATIHAGLECGILSEKIEGLDAVSFGPDILNVHTVNERLDAESAIRSFEYLKELLKNLR